MDEKDKIECLKHISTIHRAQFDERRHYEIKILFASLAFYILAIVNKLTTNIDFSEYIVFPFIILAIINLVYLGKIHYANSKNLEFAEKAEQAIDSMSGCNIFPNMNKNKRPFFISLKSINFWTQAVTIVIFCWCAILIFNKDQKEAKHNFRKVTELYERQKDIEKIPEIKK